MEDAYLLFGARSWVKACPLQTTFLEGLSAEAVLGFVSSLASASFLRMAWPVQPESSRDSVLFSELHAGAVLVSKGLSKDACCVLAPY